MSKSRSYAVYDVFSDTALAGNPLAVVFDAEGLNTQAMQKIAAEFNLSETIFILPPEAPEHDARLRIFMPRGELPFAGHPTVGGTVAICERAGATADKQLVLEETVGPISCSYRPNGYAQFKLPILPLPEELMMLQEAAAKALGITPDDIGFDNHITTQWNAGKSYLCLPVKSADVLEHIVFDEAAWLAQFPGEDPLVVDCPYIYCRTSDEDKFAIRARMFAPHHGIPEDPATGSAAAALCGALHAHDDLGDGTHVYEVEQGVEMGRPSVISIEIDTYADKIAEARIGGHAVKVAEGALLV